MVLSVPILKHFTVYLFSAYHSIVMFFGVLNYLGNTISIFKKNIKEHNF